MPDADADLGHFSPVPVARELSDDELVKPSGLVAAETSPVKVDGGLRAGETGTAAEPQGSSGQTSSDDAYDEDAGPGKV